MGNRLRCRLITLIVAIVSAALLSAEAVRLSETSVEETERVLLEAWRERQIEIRGIESRFQGSVDGFNLIDLGYVAFILEQARDMPRRFLDPDDHEFLFNAAEGQSPRELEGNLAAIVNYVRISMSARAFVPAARVRKPLLGRRKGMDTLLQIARSVNDFRSEQLRKVRSGQLARAQVLTKANLGVLGERATLLRLEEAYQEGHRQFTVQRNLMALGVLAIQLQFGVLVALWIRWKGEGFLVIRGSRR